MNQSTKLWQWPNVLAIDAALIAVLWQATLARALELPLAVPAYFVLGLSVWLTYMGDRLYDVKSREIAMLLSARHQFAKRFRRGLWFIWFAVLAVNLVSATQLSPAQLKHGVFLLVVCLSYTLLNQKLSRRFFPKELCVALIYAGGVVVFIPVSVPLIFMGGFTGLCLLNCLLIGAKEKSIDAELRVHSLAPLVAEQWLGWLAICSAISMLGIGGAWGWPWAWPLALSFGLLGLLHRMRRQIAVENFRVLADGLLLVAPILSMLESRL